MTKTQKNVVDLVSRLKENEEHEKPPGIKISQCSIELYKVSGSYDSKQVIQNIKKYAENHKGVTYVIALHDKDFFTHNTFDSHKRLVGEKGKKKDTHYHIGMTFPYPIYLNDLALALGIEDRWIMKVKKDDLMDGMYWYYTHEQYNESEKHHYDYRDFDTNIFDYLEYVIGLFREKQIDSRSDIITRFIGAITSIDNMISLPYMYQILYGMDYNLSDITKHYRQLKDLVDEHNHEVSVHLQTKEDEAAKKRFRNYVNKKILSDHTLSLVDEFGTVVVEDDRNKKYVVTNALVKEKKKK